MLIEVFLRSIKYIAEIHNKNMFHGDIKPANILFDISNLKIRISSDSGTLVQLDKENSDKKYYIRFFTPGFSSKKHIKAIKKETGETKDELLKEDKHQLITTFKSLFLNKKTDFIKQIFEDFNNDQLSVT